MVQNYGNFISMRHTVTKFLYLAHIVSISIETNKRFLIDYEHVMEWLAMYPHLNSSVDLAMPNYRQFNSLAELKAVIIEVWDNINVSLFQRFVNDMSYRIFRVIYKPGSYIFY